MVLNPNTKIYICSNVKLDREYNNVIYWNSPTEQINYFAGKAQKSYTDFTYQRQTKTIKVPCSADSISLCNYLIYQNTSQTVKWYFAFIDKVVYISDDVCEIFFTQDVFNSWWFQLQIKECFVEREHVIDDTIGANIVDEKLECGEYTSYEPPNYYEWGDYSIIVASSETTTGAGIGTVYGNIYSGILYYKYGTSIAELNRLATFISEMTKLNKISAIVSIYMLPSKLYASASPFESSKPYSELLYVERPTTIGEYIPKNKKLFTYPYTSLYVSNLSGNSALYKYEFFNDSVFGGANFKLTGSMTCNPEVQLVPLKYKCSPTLIADDNANEKITLKGFPQCSFNIDSFKAWLAQNAGSVMVNAGASLATLAGSIATANPLGMVAGVAGVANTIGNFIDKSRMPSQATGEPATNVAFSTGKLTFQFVKQQITKEYAKTIDDYFELYGYKVNKLKVPNMNTRPHWNYVKTVVPNVYCSSSENVVNQIKNKFNEGLTFWKNGDDIGDYTLNNHEV